MLKYFFIENEIYQFMQKYITLFKKIKFSMYDKYTKYMKYSRYKIMWNKQKIISLNNFIKKLKLSDIYYLEILNL